MAAVFFGIPVIGPEWISRKLCPIIEIPLAHIIPSIANSDRGINTLHYDGIPIDGRLGWDKFLVTSRNLKTF